MTAIWFLIVLALVFVVVWRYLSQNPNPRAKLGPDGTNVREPETFVVHHEGKGQGLDIANTALKERTEHVRRELPGDADKIKTPVPGRDLTKMSNPPSDVSKYGDEKVAPGASPGVSGAEPKEKVLSEGPKGSRPGTPEEPGSPYVKGRRVTDIHRDVELAADLLPNVWPEQQRDSNREMAASPSTHGQEPGYGLGRTRPGHTDGEGGDDEDAHLIEQPEITDDIPDIPEGEMPAASAERPEQPPERGRAEAVDRSASRFPRGSGPARNSKVIPLRTQDWSGLHEEIPLPDTYREDTVTALVRNPRSLYVYWERSGDGEENLRSLLGAAWNQSEPVLRIFDVTSGAYPGQPGGRSFTILVSEHDDHWFVNEGIEPGRRYVVSHERRTADGRYYLLSHSAPVDTPNEAPRQPHWIAEAYGRAPDSPSSPWK